MAANRAELLVELICQHNQDTSADDMFNLLVPRMHGQLYSLYCVLADSTVLKQCVFKTPLVEGDQITINISLDAKAAANCIDYIGKMGPILRYLRQLHYSIEGVLTSDGMSITLSPAS
jgi:hypothetical protein